MSEPRHCANCRASLPPDWPSDNRYCAKCNAAWQKGPSPSAQADAVEGDDPPTR